MSRISGKPRIWIHAVSVGEVGAAVPLITQLFNMLPDCAIILSTTTPHGQVFAKEKLGHKVTCIIAPIDIIFFVKKALNLIKPDILVCMETEIWPNLLNTAKRLGVRTALVNGRISVRSIGRYMKFRPLIKQALSRFDIMSMISKDDSLRIKSLGAPEDRVSINGNTKFDLLLQDVNDGVQKRMAQFYGIAPQVPVFVAGSTRSGEEAIILDVFEVLVRTFPECLLIIAPRHVERAVEIGALVESRGLICQFHDALKEENKRVANIIIVNTIGELKQIYSVASVVFCGGSLVPLGGQNILEPAAWGKPVIYGPSMDDFFDAKMILEENGAGIMVESGKELCSKVLYLLNHPEEAGHIGELTLKAILAGSGASERHAGAILDVLKK
ncbi:MAG: 3-deoxy-D-manno-octulosonic acid transferase [Desulfobacterales bacterium]|nr:3-deoxy-D-manno-octulosonic acid transferase [Desulfobacterales bacterium]